MKSVPPTAILNGVEASPLTARPNVATSKKLLLAGSQAAEPLSPAETKPVMPCAEACSHNAFFELVAGGAFKSFAGSEALADDGSKIVVDGVEDGEIDARSPDAGVGLLGNHQKDLCARSYRTGDLCVEVGFFFIAGNAGVWAIDNDVGGSESGRRGQTKNTAIVSYVFDVDVGDR